MTKKSLKIKSKRTPSKTIKGSRHSRKVAKKPINRKLHKRVLSTTALLLSLGAVMIVFSTWFMLRSSDLASNAYYQSTRNASSMLAYDIAQIRTAKIVGPDKQLKKEIINYQKAPYDLQNYVLNDYRNLKKNCVVNGDLVGQSYYKITAVAYSGFAIVSKGCNGEENNVLAKLSGNWASVFRGNDLIPCSIVNDYDIPQTISHNCQTNNTKFLNPNP